MLSPMMEGGIVILRGCVSHGERTRAESVGWVYMYSASKTCVCVNQGDIRSVGLRPEHLLCLAWGCG